MADGKRSPQMEEVVVHPEDGPSPQHQSVRSWENAVRGSYTSPPAYPDGGITRLPNLPRELADALEEDTRYWEFIEDAQIPRETVEDLLDKGYSPRQIYRLWIDRVPATAPRAVPLGPDPIDLSPNWIPQSSNQPDLTRPDADFPDQAPEQLDPDAKSAAKFVITKAIIKLFPRPIQWLIDAGLWSRDFWNSLSKAQQEQIRGLFRDVMEQAYELSELDLQDKLREWYLDRPTSGSETFATEGITVIAKETPTKSVRDFEISIPLEDIQINKPPQPQAVEPPPDFLKPENWTPHQENAWPEEFPPELPIVKVEIFPSTIEPVHPKWNDLPYYAWKADIKPVIKTRIKIEMRLPPKTKVAEGNTLRGPKEKKGRNYAAANAYRGLLKLINKTYGEVDELRDIYDAFRENSWIDNNGDLMLNIEQFANDIFWMQLEDKAIGKLMGKYREALQDNPTWHALSAL